MLNKIDVKYIDILYLFVKNSNNVKKKIYDENIFYLFYIYY